MTQTNSNKKTQTKPVSARPLPLARLIDKPSLQFVSGVDQISLIWGKTQILWTWAARLTSFPPPCLVPWPGTNAETHSDTILWGQGRASRQSVGARQKPTPGTF